MVGWNDLCIPGLDLYLRVNIDDDYYDDYDDDDDDAGGDLLMDYTQQWDAKDKV